MLVGSRFIRCWAEIEHEGTEVTERESKEVIARGWRGVSRMIGVMSCGFCDWIGEMSCEGF